jgi:hypothetical protein
MDKAKLYIRIAIFVLAFISVIMIWNSAGDANWDGVKNGLGFAFAALILGAFNKFVLKD